MKTLRLILAESCGGGLSEYSFGTRLLEHIVPKNDQHETVRYEANATDSNPEAAITINAADAVEDLLNFSKKALQAAAPDKVITLGGSCLVSLTPFEYLRHKYDDLGIIWLDAHPDVSTLKDGCPYTHAMVTSSLMGEGAAELTHHISAPYLQASSILYIGLQHLHDYQKHTLEKLGVSYKIQEDGFLGDEEVLNFLSSHKHIAIHFDIDVLDPSCFHSTYFANPELTGDGSGAGKMTLPQLAHFLKLINDNAELVGLTVAEYLPFVEFKLHNVLRGLDIFGK